MDMPDPKIQQYAESMTSPEPPVLARLNRNTHAQILHARMLSGHLQGALLAMISKMVRPDRILEIGTFTGYSAICLASGLNKNGLLHTIDNNPELEDFARTYFIEAGMQHMIVQHIGEAINVIPTIDEVFDIVFIDADKENYVNYFDMAYEKLRQGGIILADNVLWSGKVVEYAGKIPDGSSLDEAINAGLIPETDSETLGLLRFNEHVSRHPGVDQLLLPFRDGLMICLKV